MLLIQVLLLQTLFLTSQASLVINKHSQSSVNISDYCPKIGDCAEGTHVMCLYYNPDRLMGPMCHDAVNIIITPENAEMILNIINRVRSKVAKGTVKGKNGITLPKGYGIYRLSWDEELATFAQLWANQCMMTKDLCHATKKFPRPAQMLGMTRYSFKDWLPINSPGLYNSTTLTPDKVKYAIISVLEAWYNYKDMLTAESVQSYESRLSEFPYLMYGFVTHIGCGVSAYSEYMYKVNDDNGNLIYNAILVVCNYSLRVQRGSPVYTTDPPTGPGYTEKCGCPLGYDEDEDCLCYESGRQLPYSCRDSNRCRPPIVILPIFDVEEAPIPNLGNNASIVLDSTNEIFDRYDMLHEQKVVKDYSSMFNHLQTLDSITTKSITNFPLDVKSRYFGFGKLPKFHKNVNRRLADPVQIKRYQKSKLSIFSKPAIFELPFRRTNTSHIIKYKKDVIPRKDFSEAQKLVSKYLKDKRLTSIDVEYSTKIPNEVTTIVKTFATEKTTNNDINVTKTPVTINVKLNTDSDRKLMTLLDTLESEVKNIKVNKNDKDMFDNKIRKIYGSLVGKSFFGPIDTMSEKNMTSTSDIRKSEIKSDVLYGNKEYLDLNNLNVHDNTSERQRLNKDNVLKENDTGLNIFNNKRKFYENDRHYRRDDFKDDDDYPLEYDRRKFYQNKLVSLQRKLEFMKRNGYRSDVPEDRKLRPVRPAKPVEVAYRKPKELQNTFYMPDRARFLHGY